MIKKALVILSIVVAVGLFPGGCGSGGGNPERVVKDFWSAVQSGNMEKAATYMTAQRRTAVEEELAADNIEIDLGREFIKVFSNNFILAVKGHEIDGDTAVVHVTYTHPDLEELIALLMARAFEMMMDESMDFDNMTPEEEEEMNMRLLIEVFGEIETVDTTVDTTDEMIRLVMEDGQWKVDADIVPGFMAEAGF